ncbi:Motility integral membrane protein [hydrothermal vent metagenome]|uniref:Motility integral membrane protein n=1 Tax=hydrothermal vent metagenome TaxID=652676 RepID=A0A1W1D4L8_9ZZZZ
MLGENFVYFFTVQGFFIGIIFGILKSFNAEGLLIYTFFITAFFYLFSHIIIALYFRTITAKSQYFPKKTHEEVLDKVVKEITQREALIDTAAQITEMARQINSDSHNALKRAS